jgi:hypothetical protein
MGMDVPVCWLLPDEDPWRSAAEQGPFFCCVACCFVRFSFHSYLPPLLLCNTLLDMAAQQAVPATTTRKHDMTTIRITFDPARDLYEAGIVGDAEDFGCALIAAAECICSAAGLTAAIVIAETGTQDDWQTETTVPRSEETLELLIWQKAHDTVFFDSEEREEWLYDSQKAGAYGQRIADAMAA